MVTRPDAPGPQRSLIISTDGPEQLSDWLLSQQPHIPRKGRALDASCGPTAPAAAFFQRLNLETFASDTLESTLAGAKAHAGRATFLASPPAELDFPEDYFDVIACGAALLSLPRTALFASLRNLRRMLKPGAPLLGAADADQIERLAPSVGLLVEDLVPCGAVIKTEALFRATKI